MTVEEVAKKINRSKWAVYKAIKEKRGVGILFERRPGDGWFACASDVKRLSK